MQITGLIFFLGSTKAISEIKKSFFAQIRNSNKLPDIYIYSSYTCLQAGFNRVPRVFFFHVALLIERIHASIHPGMITFVGTKYSVKPVVPYFVRDNPVE